MQGESHPSAPGAARSIPGVPGSAEFFRLWEFLGLNTRVDRPAIADQQLAWCENLMPIDRGNLRALYDVGAAIYTATGALTITAYGTYVLGDGVPYFLVFLSDASAVRVNINTNAVTTVAAAGTFTTATGTVPAFAQYGNKFVCIVTTNGYFIYDNVNLYQYGSISPSPQITDGGRSYTSVPTVTVHTTGAGTGATLTATIANGSVVSLTETAPGSGFVVGDLVYATFAGGGAGTSPQAHATITNGVLTAWQVYLGGSGYYNANGAPTAPSVAITDPTGTGASVFAQVSGGSVVGLQISSGGMNYTNPTVVFSGGNGSGAAATITASNGVVTGVVIDAAGSGLVGQVFATMLDPNGSGAQFAVETTAAGAVSNIQVLKGGTGFAKTPLVFTGGGVAAATLSLMPTGVNGTAIETYNSQIWITGGSGQGATNQQSLTFLTAPGSASNFAASAGGGVFPSTDSFLRAKYTGIKQALGFLYLFGDSSCNYISGVQQTGTPPTTTFTNLNIDPTIGTIWPESIIVYGTTPIFANVYGVHAIVGGSVRKISDQLDGLFYTAPAIGSFRPSSALHTLYGKHIYLFNFKIVDPYTGVTENVICCWDGAKWWTYKPSVSIVSLATLEVNSAITAWGTDGTKIYPLLTTPATITKTLRSKLRGEPSVLLQKKAWGFYALFGAYAATGAAHLSVTVDTEAGSNALVFDTISGTPTATPALTVLWAKSAGAKGSGYTMGFTITSTSTDFVLYEANLVTQDYSLRT